MQICYLHFPSTKPAISLKTSSFFLALFIFSLLTFIYSPNSFAEPETTPTAATEKQNTNNITSAEIDQLLAQALKVKSSNKAESARIIANVESLQAQLNYRQQGELTYLTAYNAYLMGDRHKSVALHKSMQNSKLINHRIRASRTLLNIYLIEQNFIAGGKIVPNLLRNVEELTNEVFKGDIYEVIAYYYNELNQPQTALTFLALVNTENYTGRDHCFNYNQYSRAKLQLYGYLAQQNYIDSAIKACEQAGEYLSANLTRSDAAKNLITQHQYQLALDMLLPYLNKVEAINYNNLTLNFYAYIASVYFHLNDLDSALVFANKAKAVPIPIKYHKAFTTLYLTLAQIHQQLGNDDKALENLYIYQDKLKVSLDIEQQKQLASAQIDNNVYGTYRYRDKLVKQKQLAEAKHSNALSESLAYISKFEQGRIIFALQILCIFILAACTLYLRHLQIVENEKNQHDPLTRLFNRNRFMDLTATSIYQHKKLQANLSILVVNIDNFRGFNQKYNCNKGDQLLTLITQTLSNYVLKDQHIARIGADEFTLFLPQINAKQAVQVAENIHLEVAALSNKMHLQDERITVSIGITDSELSEFSLKYLLCDSSKALRKAKASGGNKTCCFEPTMSERDKYKVDESNLKYIYDE